MVVTKEKFRKTFSFIVFIPKRKKLFLNVFTFKLEFSCMADWCNIYFFWITSLHLNLLSFPSADFFNMLRGMRMTSAAFFLTSSWDSSTERHSPVPMRRNFVLPAFLSAELTILTVYSYSLASFGVPHRDIQNMVAFAS